MQQNRWEQAPTGLAAAQADRFAALIPTLSTARLNLRAPRVTDFDVYAEILMSERASHMGGPFDRNTSWLDFAQNVGTWALHGHGLWTVELNDNGQILGFVLIGLEFGDHEPEVGYFFTEAHEGKGFAFEAAEAIRDYALGVLGLGSVVSYIDPPNIRSIRLAERLGAKRDITAEAALSGAVRVYRHVAPAEATQ